MKRLTWAHFGVFVLFALQAGVARSEQLIGIESAPDASVVHRSEVDASDAVPLSSEKRLSPPPAEGVGLGVAGGLNAVGAGSFGSHVTVSYGLSPYFGIDMTGRYNQYDFDERNGQSYGGDMAFVLRGTNPSILTPFVGVGPGYVKWRRVYQGEMFDDASSLTLHAFGGLNIKLSRNFGLQGQRRQTIYLGERPLAYNDQSREARVQVANQVGFYMAF